MRVVCVYPDVMYSACLLFLCVYSKSRQNDHYILKMNLGLFELVQSTSSTRYKCVLFIIVLVLVMCTITKHTIRVQIYVFGNITCKHMLFYASTYIP